MLNVLRLEKYNSTLLTIRLWWFALRIVFSCHWQVFPYVPASEQGTTHSYSSAWRSLRAYHFDSVVKFLITLLWLYLAGMHDVFRKCWCQPKCEDCWGSHSSSYHRCFGFSVGSSKLMLPYQSQFQSAPPLEFRSLHEFSTSTVLRLELSFPIQSHFGVFSAFRTFPLFLFAAVGEGYPEMLSQNAYTSSFPEAATLKFYTNFLFKRESYLTISWEV